MGQGTDSCGGWDVDYDPYEEGLASGRWTTRDGGEVHVSKMTLSHLRGARAVAERAKRRVSFTADAEKWSDWIDVFDREIHSREREAIDKPQATKPRGRTPQGTTKTMVCHCGATYEARTADLKRGWAYSCSKSCAAARRTHGLKRAVPAR